MVLSEGLQSYKKYNIYNMASNNLLLLLLLLSLFVIIIGNCSNLLLVLSVRANIGANKESVLMIYLVSSFKKLFDSYFAGVD